MIMLYAIRNYFRHLAEGYEHGKLSYWLLPLVSLASKLYGAAVAFVQGLYQKSVLKKTKLPFPVVSVGNITWGGTGKTPFVEYLAHKISDWGKTPLVLTRGYSHDEVEQLKKQLPKAVIGVGKDRVHSATEAAKAQPIHFAILDDGFQHWKVERNLEIVMINSLNPFGNGELIPRGILREPVSSLKRAQMVVLSHANLLENDDLQKLRAEVSVLAPHAAIIEAVLEPLFFYRYDEKRKIRIPLEKLRGQKVTTFSAIGTPRSFQMLLSRSHMRPIRNFEFADHHEFAENELEEIKRVSASAGIENIITTEKDFYRNPKLMIKVLNPLILAARLRIAAGEDLLFQKLNQLFGSAV